MPFVCKYQLNNGAIDDSDEIIFNRFVNEPFGLYHREPVRLAEIHFNGLPAFIYSNSPGFPSTKGSLKSGDKINSETEIAYFTADGEDIPYGRPYAVIRVE